MSEKAAVVHIVHIVKHYKTLLIWSCGGRRDFKRLWTYIPRNVDGSGTKAENRHVLLDLDSPNSQNSYYSSSRLNNQSNYGPDDSDKKGGLDENKNAVGSFESSVSGSGGGKREGRRMMRVDEMLARAEKEKTEEMCVRVWPTFFSSLRVTMLPQGNLSDSDWWK